MRKALVIAAATVLLAACETAPEQNDDVAGRTTPTPERTAPVTPPQPEVDPFAMLTQEVGDRVFFDLDSSSLDNADQATLQRQADWMRQFSGVSITVEGHCDERGTREYNLALGDRRATSVKNYLVALGISPARVETISYGKERPAVLGSNEAAWAQNRRAVTVPR